MTNPKTKGRMGFPVPIKRLVGPVTASIEEKYLQNRKKSLENAREIPRKPLKTSKNNRQTPEKCE